VTARLPRLVDVRRVVEPKTMAIEASEDERNAIAEALDVPSVDALAAQVTLKPWRGEGVRVSGTVRGALHQTCVVTLEPVAKTVDEAFDLRFHPDVEERETIEVDPEAPEPPERLTGNALDVGALALEHFMLGIDPYPRAPEAAFEPPQDDGEEEPSPFAALAALKHGGR